MPLGCESRTNAGIVQYLLGSLKEAYREFEEALKLCPSDPNAVLWKGKVELMMGQYDKAINTLRQSDSAEGDPQVQEPFKTLIKRMTDPDPMKRPTMSLRS